MPGAKTHARHVLAAADVRRHRGRHVPDRGRPVASNTAPALPATQSHTSVTARSSPPPRPRRGRLPHRPGQISGVRRIRIRTRSPLTSSAAGAGTESRHHGGAIAPTPLLSGSASGLFRPIRNPSSRTRRSTWRDPFAWRRVSARLVPGRSSKGVGRRRRDGVDTSPSSGPVSQASFAPSGAAPPVAYRHSATSSLRAKATRNTCRILPCAVPARLRNHRDSALSGWYRSQRHAI